MSKQKMSADQLSACRKRLKQHWKSRIVDESLLHRAWHVAHEVAALLYEQFDATQVAVFGSLTEPMWFTKGSDIDIAVSGLSHDLYDKAYKKVMNFDSEFKIDLINFDTSQGTFPRADKTSSDSYRKKHACPHWHDRCVVDALQTSSGTGFPR